MTFRQEKISAGAGQKVDTKLAELAAHGASGRRKGQDPMLNQFQEPDAGLRYDPQMQQRVVELAARLQQEDLDRLTVHQIMDAAGEIGLEPQYVQKALALVQAEQTAPIVRPVTKKRVVTPTHAEYRRFVTAMTAPMALGALAFAFKDVTSLAAFFTLILPVPLAGLSGFLTGRKRVGFVTAALLILALAPTVYHLGIHDFYRTHSYQTDQFWFLENARNSGVSAVFGYLMMGTPLAGALGLFGAWTRGRYFPTPSTEED